jgi:hypothetical protein
MLLLSNLPREPHVSLQLSSETAELRAWAHSSRSGRSGPAAAEWDEREETLWPLPQEAAKTGLYSLDFFATSGWSPSAAVQLGGLSTNPGDSVARRRGTRGSGQPTAGRGRDQGTDAGERLGPDPVVHPDAAFLTV